MRNRVLECPDAVFTAGALYSLWNVHLLMGPKLCSS